MSFDWTKTSDLYANKRGKITKVGRVQPGYKAVDSVYDTIQVFDENNQSIFSVYKSTGCGWDHVNPQKTKKSCEYVFHKDEVSVTTNSNVFAKTKSTAAPTVKAPEVVKTFDIKTASDEEIAKRLREADAIYNEMHLELEARGYTIFDKNGIELEVYEAGKITKEITTEKLI